jgi:trypsin
MSCRVRLARRAAAGVAVLVAAGCTGESWPAPELPESIDDEHLGERRQGIIDGQEAQPGEFSFMVGLGYRDARGRRSVQCGGSILTDHVIITAGHCIGFVQYAFVGAVDLSSDEMLDISVANVIRHPSYQPLADGGENDVALVFLSEPIADEHYHPIRLNRDPHQPAAAGEQAVSLQTIGWGRTEAGFPAVLRKVQVPWINNDLCAAEYARDQEYDSMINWGMMCAGGDGRKDSCNGDSGGPLFAADELGRPVLYGLTSYGKDCATRDFPGVYARVSSYIDFIRSTIREQAGVSIDDLLTSCADPAGGACGSAPIIPPNTRAPFLANSVVIGLDPPATVRALTLGLDGHYHNATIDTRRCHLADVYSERGALLCRPARPPEVDVDDRLSVF